MIEGYLGTVGREMKLPIAQLERSGGGAIPRRRPAEKFQECESVGQGPLGRLTFHVPDSRRVFRMDLAGIAAVGKLQVSRPSRGRAGLSGCAEGQPRRSPDSGESAGRRE